MPHAAAVDAAHARISGVQDAYSIQEITAPAREDPMRFGVGTYGFYLKDLDGNWWRIEENAGPFGSLEIPADAEPRDAILPPGPIAYVTLECRELAPTLPLLIPGVGAQGGDAVATVRAGWREDGPIIVNSSRAVLYAGSGLDDFAAAARRAALQTRDQLKAARRAV